MNERQILFWGDRADILELYNSPDSKTESEMFDLIFSFQNTSMESEKHIAKSEHVLFCSDAIWKLRIR